MTYTYRTGPRPEKHPFMDVVAVFDDGGLKAYNACSYHLDEVIREEEQRLRNVEGAPEVVRWHKLPIPFPNRVTEHDCAICFQLEEAGKDPSKVYAIGRVPSETLTDRQQRARRRGRS